MNPKKSNEIKRSNFESSLFQGFTINKVLIKYDFPLLLEATSPEGESWLFKWCDTFDKDQNKIERWIALPISKSRLTALKKGSMSLRQVVTLPEKEFYLFDAENLFDPSEIKKSSPEKMPSEYIPSDDISIHGNLIGIEPPEGENFKVRLHVFSEYISEGKTPLFISSNLQILFQHYITWVSHAIDESPDEGLPSPVFDWAGLDLVTVSSGSFKMECESKSTGEQTENLTKACELLAALSNGTFGKEDFKEKFSGLHRSDIILLASSLAQFISNSKVSMSISWATSSNPKGYLALDKRRARKYLRFLNTLRDDKYLRNITIQLTPKEADPIRQQVKGTGGMEDLLRYLQKKLRKDNTISLSSEDIEKILRYGFAYGQGGFENKLMGLAMTIRRIGFPFNTV